MKVAAEITFAVSGDDYELAITAVREALKKVGSQARWQDGQLLPAVEIHTINQIG